MSKQDEMEDIYRSYEYLIREKLEALDHMARRMFVEMGAFGIPKLISEAFVQEQFKLLAIDVAKKGGENVGRKDEARTNRTKRSKSYES